MRLLLCLAVSALTLCGCATKGAAPKAPPPLAVKVPVVCERLLPPVPWPPVTAGDDARAAFVRDEGALKTARGEIARGRHCVIEQRQLYAAPQKE